MASSTPRAPLLVIARHQLLLMVRDFSAGEGSALDRPWAELSVDRIDELYASARARGSAEVINRTFESLTGFARDSLLPRTIPIPPRVDSRDQLTRVSRMSERFRQRLESIVNGRNPLTPSPMTLETIAATLETLCARLDESNVASSLLDSARSVRREVRPLAKSARARVERTQALRAQASRRELVDALELELTRVHSFLDTLAGEDGPRHEQLLGLRTTHRRISDASWQAFELWKSFQDDEAMALVAETSSGLRKHQVLWRKWRSQSDDPFFLRIEELLSGLP